MPPTKEKKRKVWDKEAMAEAVTAVRENKMGYLRASKIYGVPKGTIERYSKDSRSIGELLNVKLGKKPVLPQVLEEKLVQYCVQMDERFFGLRRSDIKRLAFQLAIQNGLSHPFCLGKEAAGKKWLRGFLGRHPQLSVRTPEGMSSARAKGFSRENVDSFFDIYEKEFDKVQPHRVFNVDETGVTVVQNKKTKVISLKGKKAVSCITSAERGKLITVVTCMNATGVFVPPMLIFPRINMTQPLMNGAPSGSIWGCHPSGWIQMDLFTKWFVHFIKFTKPTKSDPVLLVLDGHYSHTRNVEVIDMARNSYITIICLPPHSTHRMQPLDVGFMGPLKTYYSQEIETWLRNNPGKVVTHYQVAEIFGKAYTKATTMAVAEKAFRKTGLVPCTRNVFVDIDFVPDDESEDMPGPHAPAQGTGSTNSGSNPVNPLIEPSDISPVPSKPYSSGTSSRSGSAAVVTTSPYKNNLMEKAAKKVENQKKKLDKTERPVGANSKPATSAVSTSKTKTISVFSSEASSSKKKAKISIKQTKKRRPKQAPSPPSESSTEDDEEPPLQDSDSDFSSDDSKEMDECDAECVLCSGLFSKDRGGEKWRKCAQCFQWCHEECGDKRDSIFLCGPCHDI